MSCRELGGIGLGTLLVEFIRVGKSRCYITLIMHRNNGWRSVGKEVEVPVLLYNRVKEYLCWAS